MSSQSLPPRPLNHDLAHRTRLSSSSKSILLFFVTLLPLIAYIEIIGIVGLDQIHVHRSHEKIGDTAYLKTAADRELAE